MSRALQIITRQQRAMSSALLAVRTIARKALRSGSGNTPGSSSASCCPRRDGDYVHRLMGYTASAIVLVRLSWAAVSRSHAGLAALRPSVSQSRAYLRLLVRGQAPRSAGHNPLGVWMVWLLWILVLLLGVTGWMSRLVAFWGDDFVHDARALLADMMLIAVILHLVGVATMSWLWRENLPASMITGYRRPLR